MPLVPDLNDPAAARKRIDAHEFWYHTIDVAPGLTTPGWFDLRHVVDDLPWPDLTGKRCLDIGTFDGFFAFEMERRGAAEVVAVDIEDHRLWDWPPDARPGTPGLKLDVGFTGPPKGAGFRLVHDVIGSKIDWQPISIYDLSPANVGTFDVVVCGSLLLHLRDPIRALEAVREIVRPEGHFLSSEQIELWLSIVGKGRPLHRLNGSGKDCQWWNTNSGGHKRILYAAGFELDRTSRPFMVRFNVHPKPHRSVRNLRDALAFRALTGDRHPGVLHQAVLTHRRV